MLRLTIALLVLFTTPVAAFAQVPPGAVPPGMPLGSPVEGFASQTPLIGGITVSCSTAPDNGNIPVIFVFDYNLNDAGLAVPAQFAPSPFGPQLVAPPRIFLNPAVLVQMPFEEQRFIGGHECAHHFLPAMLRMNENDADCWSAMEGHKQGWFDPSVFPRMQQTFANNTGNWSHAPGPVRFGHIVNCYNGVPDGIGDDVSLFIV
jgi:hypothetical protein